MTSQFQNFGIIGGGAWGTALALVLLRAGRTMTLWVHAAEVAASINRHHENRHHLPGVTLDPQIMATESFGDLTTCDAYILTTPAQRTRTACQQLRTTTKVGNAPVIICAKGIEQKTLSLMSEVVAQELPGHPVAVLSGPTFAVEVARGQPTALTLAIKDQARGEQIVQAIGTRTFRPYLTDDVPGAQIGGAIKNVLAVACGILAGRNMGENARAALVTRGLAEMIRLGTALGGRAETLMGLSGLGDLVLTCSSAQSRNTSLGMALGQGTSLANILAARTSVAEGVFTAAAAHALAKKHKIEMPIVAAVDAILNHNADIDETISVLLARPFRAETL